MFEQTEKIEKKIDENISKILEESLPLAFAIVKETAFRFTNNEYIEVQATDFDRQLATTRDNIQIIEGNKARWFNQWLAGGNTITWDMVHYDVQLIGGVVLHNGKNC